MEYKWFIQNVCDRFINLILLLLIIMCFPLLPILAVVAQNGTQTLLRARLGRDALDQAADGVALYGTLHRPGGTMPDVNRHRFAHLVPSEACLDDFAGVLHIYVCHLSANSF